MLFCLHAHQVPEVVMICLLLLVSLPFLNITRRFYFHEKFAWGCKLPTNDHQTLFSIRRLVVVCVDSSWVGRLFSQAQAPVTL